MAKVLVATEKPFSKGSGTESDPYQIASAGDLTMMADLCNGADYASFTDKHFRQTADINMQDVTIPAILR